MPTRPRTSPDLSPYAGRWIALVHGQVAGVGRTAAEARRAAHHARPKEEPRIFFVPEDAATRIPLPGWPWREVLRIAQARDTRLWLVGGTVRDILLGRPTHDWDFVTPSPREALGLARAVADALHGSYYLLDSQRGVGRALLTGPDGRRLQLDFAALRGNDLEADLLARDFTVNALAVTGDGVLIDLVGGLDDLRRRLIRATSEHAFRDDPLRLLRAVRLEADLGLTIAPRTLALVRRDAPLLAIPSVERVSDELLRILALAGAARHVARLDELTLLEHVLPELTPLKGVAQSPPHRFDVWQHTLFTLDATEMVLAAAVGDEATPHLADAPAAAWDAITRALAPFADRLRAHLATEVSSGRNRALLLKLAALLHDIGKPETRSQGDNGRIHFYRHESVGARLAARRLTGLHLSRDEVRRVRQIVLHHLRPAHLAQMDTITRRAIYRYFRAAGDAGVEIALFRLADLLATYGPNLPPPVWERELTTAGILITHFFEHYDETISPPPLVTGHDLMAELGLPQGPEIGRLLDILREAQAAGEIHTRAEGLAMVKTLLAKEKEA